ncbi:response regulator [Spirosoma endbachense]|uniref:Response regulator n=1 Tax=Spirosoma endbachense TaxID=2666025 RepID=A0A6P1VZS1_9BACT|nr:response regulator [Spirosoma endbachense]QHV98681.1 response regulator [Spirosoma endbachense]
MKYTILVVDDDDDDFLMLSSLIKQCQQDVTLYYVQNGLEATQKLIDGLQPNLILVDVQMPLMDGYELVLWLMNSEAWRHIPVVIWTGEISDREVTRYYRAGANALMLKQDALQDVEAFCKYWLKLVQLPQLVWQEPG